MPQEPEAGNKNATTGLTWLDEIVGRFEDAWLHGQNPAILDHMPEDPGHRLQALVELVHIDLERRLNAGEAVRVEGYLERFPELASQPDLVVPLVQAEYDQRRRSDPALNFSEYVRRFPQFQEQLQQLIADDSTQPPVGEPGSVQMPTGPAAGNDGETPARLGRYRITGKLGSGGFGVVYKGYDEDLRREVAIKVPRRDRIAKPEDAEAYLAEARVVASLDHPHIVPVYDLGRTEDGLCFVVAKFIEGSDLSKRIKDNRPSFGESAELVATLAEALHHAHRRGLVHRDVKPGNILLDPEGIPYLADFGLALKEEDYGKGGGFCGTPAYMSPEQANGEGHRVDGRSDIFSLGSVFYELLTGRRSFRGETPTDIIIQISSDGPRPPRQVDDTIPKELERICLKALSKRASERYTTAKDMADDLWHFLNSPQLVATQKGATGNSSPQMGLSDQRVKVVRGTFFFADFKGFTERVRILEKAAGHQAAAEMKRTVTYYIHEAFRQLDGEIKPADYELIDTAGDGFFFHFRLTKDAFRLAEALQQITTAHNAQVTDEIAEHWFRSGAATGDVAWDEGKPVGHVVIVASRLQAASIGGDFVIDPASYDDLPPDIQQQFGPKESIRDKHDKTYDVYRTAFGRLLPPLPISNPTNPTIPVFSSTPASDSQPIKIVPKGLRSFDAHDADFFLELLPGPRDRDGLPDSIRFWKTRIEETDPDNTFSVGLIYGPSGCGKSSLVKAGLLPRLSENLIVVFVEATAAETETRLQHGLRKRCPALPDNLSLKETLAALRRGQGIPVGKKVLIVLDQFEQWLHAKKEEKNTELVQALRQCDGERLQCVVMVRDDFWMAATRFMKDLEIRLVEGQNSAAVDLFDADHARKVLAAFGWAFGKLPDNPCDTSKDQKEFLKQAVSGLAQEGKIISVRLALFAEMMKGKGWTPTTLKEVGGTEGVGVTFLEETFSAVTAPPEHRYHQKAARTVLKTLLPESGTDIKGHMRSYAELLEASGYGSRPKDFDDLIRILDNEIRLITPTDPEGKDANTDSVLQTKPGQKYYQLTHDYLVHSLRDWLTRKQKETKRGRAELLLADRAAVWNARPENRQLPSLLQWFNIRWWTQKKNWTPPQRKMMSRASRVHAVRGIVVGVLLAVATFTGLAIRDQFEERRKATFSGALVQSLLNADTAQVPAIVGEMAEYRKWVDPLLREEFDKAAVNSRQKLHASLALLPVDSGQVDYLKGRLLEAEPHEVPVIRDGLAPHKDGLLDKLWAVVEKPGKGEEQQRLLAAAALAKYDPDNDKWAKLQEAVGNDLVAVPAVYLSLWMDSLRPVRAKLFPQLSTVYRNASRRETERSLATDILADYASDNPQLLADLLMDADDKQFAVIYPKLKDRGEQGLPLLTAVIDTKLPADLPSSDGKRETLAKRQANAAVALLRMNQPAKVWPLLKHTSDPRVRSYLVDRLSPLGADAKAIVGRLDQEPDITVRRALILSLGEFAEKEFTPDDRKALLRKLREMYRTVSDPGLHASAEWLLRKWKQEAWLKQINDEWAKDKQLQTKASGAALAPGASPQWYVNTQGQTFVVIPGPVEFVMGSPPTEVGREGDEKQHPQRIGRTFVLAAKPVTLGEYRKFEARYGIGGIEQLAPTADSPVVATNWFRAVEYCNWLSKQEGLPESEWCYKPFHDPKAWSLLAVSSVGLLGSPWGQGAYFAMGGMYPGRTDAQYEGGMSLARNYLQRQGYRLPTEAEMEYATRAGAVTTRYYGETEELLPKYAWYNKNSQERTWPVGSLKPNDLGLFDVQGNAFTWCQERYKGYPAEGKKAADDKEDDLVISSTDSRVLCGGSFTGRASGVRSANRIVSVPTNQSGSFGFRPAKTLPLSSFTALPPTPEGGRK